tara:strand:+ start:19363 stop:19614 length:252 start_codon:yes stop_codon:yes gene_type:complete
MSANAPPSIKLNGAEEPTTMTTQPPVSSFGEPNATGAERPAPSRADTTFSKFSTMSVPPDGSILTGKQEHCMHHLDAVKHKKH